MEGDGMSATDKVKEADWRLFRSRLPIWQEAYMERLNREYIALLSGTGSASETFWELERRMREDKRRGGVVMRMSRSDMELNLLSLLSDGVISTAELDGFSEELREKQKYLLSCVHSRKIKVNYHDSTTSFLEGVFAKGDRRLAPVILEAYKRGCYFDGWEECFQYDTWLKVFEDMGIDPKFYCQRPIGLDEVTPWSHMDYGVTHEYLVREYNKALAAQTTQPCNRACHGCGANHLLGGPCFDYSQDLV